MTTIETTARPSTKERAQVDVSVAMVSWNASHFLSPCLTSIYDAGRNHVEVIVVDNNSRDGSADLVESEFPTAGVIRNDSNPGFAKATNQAIRLSHGRYVLLLNPDTVLSPSAIPDMVDFLDQHPQVGAVGPRILNSEGETIESFAPFPGWQMALRGIWVVMTASFDCKLQPSSFEPKPVDWVCGACMMVRREALDQIGLLDEDYFMYWEETDLCWRLHRGGWDVYYLPGVCMTHYVAGSSVQADGKIYLNGLLLNEWIKSASRFLQKHYPLWSWLALAVMVVISALFALVVSPVVYLVVPSHREQARAIVVTYGKVLVAQLRAAIGNLGARPQYTERTRFKRRDRYSRARSEDLP